MLILGIESSCDETAVAVVRDGREVLSSKIASQIDVHAVFGGVVPEVASREHLRAIRPIFDQAMAEANVSLDDIDAISVSQGPGLIGALLVGVSFAKGLAVSQKKPIVPIDHVHAHIHGALLGIDSEDVFPTLALVVSGGHTNLYYMTDPVTFKLIASSIDDACGECFDKVGKLLGLGYPGGPEIEALAAKGEIGVVPMPKMVEQKDRMVFSYSGLKTHMANLLRKKERASTEDICAAFQEEALGQILRKLKVALKNHNEAKSILIAGGVAANNRFRELTSGLSVPVHFPSLKYCSDNAAMIAAMAHHRIKYSGIDTFTSTDWDSYSRYDFEAVL
jgi:N6-L-threonylcarbamoyladenine synthase